MHLPQLRGRIRGAVPGRTRRSAAMVAAAALSLFAVFLLPGQGQAGTVAARASASSTSPASSSTSAELVIPAVPAAGISAFDGSWGTSETGPDGGIDSSSFADPDGVLSYLSAATRTSTTYGVVAPPVWFARSDLVHVQGPSLRPGGPRLVTVNEVNNHVQCNPPHAPLASAQLTPPPAVAFGKPLTEGTPLDMDLSGAQLGLPDVSYGSITFLITRTVETTGVLIASARTTITISGTLYDRDRAPVYSGPLAALTLGDVFADCTVAPIDANVRIIKDGPATVDADGTVTYTLAAINDGPGDANNVVISDEISGQMHDVAGLPSACSLTQETVRCSLGTMTVGETRDISFTDKVKPTVPGGSVIENCGTLTTTTPETDYTDNAQCVTTTVLDRPTNLSVTAAAPATAAPGESITYEFPVVNHGPTDAADTVVTIELSDKLAVITGVPVGCILAGRTLTCDVGTFPAGDTKTLHVTGTVADDVTDGTVFNGCATVTTSTPQTNYDDDSDCAPTIVAVPPPPPSADLGIVKTGPASAPPGGAVAYTLTVTNHGPDPAADSVVTDVIPAGLDVTSVPVGCALAGRTVTCDLGTLAVDASRTVTLDTTVTAAAGSSIENCAAAETSTHDTDLANNESCVQTGVSGAPFALSTDLSIVKAGPPSVATGGAAAYTLTVTNHGPDPAADSVVTDVIPAGLDVTGTPAGCARAGRTLTCDLGTLAVGASRTISLDTTVTAAAGTSVQNCATAETSTHDLNPANSESCAQTEVPDVPTPPAHEADLVLRKEGPGLLMPGDLARYSLTVTNRGPHDAAGVTVTDVLASTLTITDAPAECASTGHTVTCDLGPLPVGASRIITLTTRVAPDAEAGTLTGDCATTGSDTPDPDPGNSHSCAETIVAAPTPAPDDADLAIVKTGTAAAHPGGQVSYTLTVVNHGPAVADDTIIGDPLPGELSAFATPAGCTVHGRLLSCRLGGLAAGAKRTFALTGTLTTDITPNSVVENCATTYTTSPERTTADNASCARTRVLPGPPTVPVTG